MRKVAPPLLALFAAAVGLGGCSTRDNPATCDSKEPNCASPLVCDLRRNLCVTKEQANAPLPGRDGGDGPAKVDAGPDLPPDAAGTCSDNNHCLGELKFCFENRCVGCRDGLDCPRDKPMCNASKTCESCLAAADAGAPACMAPRPFCDSTGACVECQASADCPEARPACDDTKTCAMCKVGQDEPCAARAATPVATPVCGPAGVCVGCNKSADCKQAETPICEANKCVACKTDKQCADRGDGPGVCLIERAGRCATEAETIYVKNAAGACAMGTGPGSQAMPFCQPADAVAAVTAERRVLVLRGPAPLGGLAVSATGAAVTVVGQMGAEIAPGAARGIDVRAGDVLVRGLTVRDSEDTGVTVAGAATLRISRCIIKGNKKGGMTATGGAGFDVSNCVFDRNAEGLVGPSLFGGAYFEIPAGDRPRVFRFNTVVGNTTAGIVCNNTGVVAESSLLFGNGGSPTTNAVVCGVSMMTSKVGVDPQFGATPYHLGPSSPCRNAGHATEYPPEDLDGQVRPQDAISDCGADEYYP